MDTIAKGDITTAMLTARFLRKGWQVLKPLSEGSRYDLLIDRGCGFERVQCKTGRMRNGCIVFSAYSVHGQRVKTMRFYLDDIDLFGIFCFENDQCYLVPISVVGKNGHLRVDPTKSNRKKGVKYAADYLLSW